MKSARSPLPGPVAAFGILIATPLYAQDSDLAKKLSNPVADLISLPIQSNYDFGIGPGDGTKWTTNFQPFTSFTTPKATTFGLNVESTHDWQGNQWIVPINATVSQLMKFGDQPVSLSAGIRYYAEKPDDGPEWGLRLGITFLFSKS